MKKSYLFLLLVSAASVLLLSGCTQQQQPEENYSASTSKSPFVIINASGFNPPLVSIKKGGAVGWINKDSVPHTVTAEGIFDSGIIGDWNGFVFDSGIILAGNGFGYKFREAGTFDYICTLHPNEKGRVIVEE